MATIETVTEEHLDELLPLMRGYCDFYNVNPSDEDLLIMSRTLIADPEREGLQLIARDDDGTAIGFATIFWTWATSKARRIGVMNDLFVHPDARGGGYADKLIMECVERVKKRGAAELEWQTALDNERAQAVYDRVGGQQERWLTYVIEV